VDPSCMQLNNPKENKVLPCSDIHLYYGFYIRRLQQCELIISGHALHSMEDIHVDFEYGGVFRSTMTK